MRIGVDENGAMKLKEDDGWKAPWKPAWPPLAEIAKKIEAAAKAKRPEQPAVPALTIADLTEPEMLAMIQMSRLTREQAIWHRLKQNFSAPPFTLSTFIGLRDKGLARLPEGKVYHALTWAGYCLAHDVADHLQQKHNVHQAYLLGRARALITLNCTCNWGCAIRAGDNIQAKADRAFSSHLARLAMQSGHETALAPVSQGTTRET